MSWHDKSEFLWMQCVNASQNFIIVVFWSDRFTVFFACQHREKTLVCCMSSYSQYSLTFVFTDKFIKSSSKNETNFKLFKVKV